MVTTNMVKKKICRKKWSKLYDLKSGPDTAKMMREDRKGLTFVGVHTGKSKAASQAKQANKAKEKREKKDQVPGVRFSKGPNNTFDVSVNKNFIRFETESTVLMRTALK